MNDPFPYPVRIVPRGRDPWVVVEDPDQVKLYRREWGSGMEKPSRVVCWADLKSRAARITDLDVYSDAMSHPGFGKADRLDHDLRFLVNLRSLTIPMSFVPRLDPGALPASLRRISVIGGGRGSFPKGRIFPGVQELDAYWTSGMQAKFEPGAFPALQDVSCRLDPRGALFDVLATYPSLTALRSGPIKDPGMLARLAPVAIAYLDLERGSLASLDGVQRIRGLRHIRLKNLNRLVDLSALELCEDLEALQIHYCTNLRDHRPLLRIPRLKDLFLYRCKSLDREACGLDLASIPGLKLRNW